MSLNLSGAFYSDYLPILTCYQIRGEYILCLMKLPTFRHEKRLISEGYRVIGVDEVGCGCLAGPVIAAAIELPPSIKGIRIADSKLLSPMQRMQAVSRFIEIGIGWTIGMATVEEIEALNIRRATYLAMKRAIHAFDGATFALIDAWTIPGLRIAQKGIIHGDRIVKSIAAASIVAKVVRDALMCEYDSDIPLYGFAKHKGYGTLLHRNALRKYGPSVLHRGSFVSHLC